MLPTYIRTFIKNQNSIHAGCDKKRKVQYHRVQSHLLNCSKGDFSYTQDYNHGQKDTNEYALLQFSPFQIVICRVGEMMPNVVISYKKGETSEAPKDYDENSAARV